jgi:hypothetical protein
MDQVAPSSASRQSKMGLSKAWQELFWGQLPTSSVALHYSMPTRQPVIALERHRDEALVNVPSENMALVDVESYPAFLGKGTDYFDMMAHLSDQMQALTAIAWKAPDPARNLRLCLAGDDRILEQTRPHRVMIASGNVRCYGQLCLATHERLFDSARHRTHRLLRAEKTGQAESSWLLNVPPGVYSIFIYYHAGPLASGLPTDYTALLRHYPFPPPRVAPIRMSRGFLPDSFKEPADADAITSHQRIW